jgi:hypothetical protein
MNAQEKPGINSHPGPAYGRQSPIGCEPDPTQPRQFEAGRGREVRDPEDAPAPSVFLQMAGCQERPGYDRTAMHGYDAARRRVRRPAEIRPLTLPLAARPRWAFEQSSPEPFDATIAAVA